MHVRSTQTRRNRTPKLRKICIVSRHSPAPNERSTEIRALMRWSRRPITKYLQEHVRPLSPTVQPLGASDRGRKRDQEARYTRRPRYCVVLPVWRRVLHARRQNSLLLPLLLLLLPPLLWLRRKCRGSTVSVHDTRAPC